MTLFDAASRDAPPEQENSVFRAALDRDWLPIVVAATVIEVQFLLFNYLQESGFPVYVFEMRTGLSIVITHAVYVVFESAVLVYFALLFEKEAIRSIELQDIGDHLKVVGGRIDLTSSLPFCSF